MNLAPIVEGHGEVSAAPVLLRRIAHSANRYDIEIARPIRIKRQRIAPHFREIERAVGLALSDPATEAILILLDADDDCPAELGPHLLERGRAVSQGKPVSVVLATREYEGWFLAGIESLRGRRGISDEASCPVDPESIRGAKERLEGLMDPMSSYSETIDQAALSAELDIDAARKRAPSLDKLCRDLNVLLQDTPPS